ncbi:MAG: hypothetical protein K9N34_09660 [Candidatus Marinimicrobia bacterium]|nr:hypothetical protein [Candidatus Neomarinimicrobiota bacterium]
MKKILIIGLAYAVMTVSGWAAEPTLKYPNKVAKMTATDPLLNRARAYASKGELQFATQNYGSFIQYSSGAYPAGYYKGYQYISDVSFILGAPGRVMGDTKAYPWAVRPRYDTNEKRHIPGDLVYWGSTVSESWFDRTDASKQVDWESVEGARGRLHSGEVAAGEIYGGLYTDTGDPYPLLASSDVPLTWPILLNQETGKEERTWPGDWAVVTDEAAPNYLEPIPGTFIGDQDVYMEFDDRLATRDEDPTQGYPTGTRVRVNAHSYGRSYAEDVVFFTVQIINESWKGFPLDTTGDGEVNVVMVPYMVGPDSVRYEYYPRGFRGDPNAGFEYKELFGGFYFDVDSYSLRGLGSDYSGRTNDDDMMAFDTTYNMAFIWDWDDNSTGAHDLAYSALKLLDTPKASRDIDYDGDGVPEITQGSSLGLTDWHWIDWYKRPGVTKDETGGGSCSGSDPYAGAAGCPGAVDKEAIMYALMAGDTSYAKQDFYGWDWRGIPDGSNNPMSSNYNSWYFHADDAGNLNPHFDSLEGLRQAFPDGLDCVFIMSAGPFDLAPGDTTNFSFAVAMGDPPSDTKTLETPPDLAKNAEIAQIMYDLHYQGFSPPQAPTVSAIPQDGKVTLYWDSAAEDSRDIVTGQPDFEGYKIYKSTDGGVTWGDPARDRVYNTDQQAVGWKPIAQFDLTQKEDEDLYGKSYDGPDQVAPWLHLGNNTGLEHKYEDTDVLNGVTYTYGVVAYDIGIDSLDSHTSDGGKWKYMLESLENFKGTSDLLPQVVHATPDARPSNAPKNWTVELAPWNVGTGNVSVLPADKALVEGNDHVYRILVDADPLFKGGADSPLENNPLYIGNPTYSVIDTTTGDTLIGWIYKYVENPDPPGDSLWVRDTVATLAAQRMPVEMGYKSKLGSSWGGFQLFTENIDEATLDTIEWVNKPKSIAPTYNFSLSSGISPLSYACDYELRWGETDTAYTARLDLTDPPKILPFSTYNISAGKKVKVVLLSSGGSPDQVANPEYPDFYSGRKMVFKESAVPGFDSLNTKSTYNLTISWPPDSLADIRHYEASDVTQINMLKPFHRGDEYYFDATTVTEMATVTKELLEEVRVVPNPYIVTAGWETDINHKALHFTHLPDECTIKIFTLNGELVYTLLQEDIFSGQAEWNLRSMNRQEVAPGLYVFVVEAPNYETFVGKFAVIR